MSGFFKKLFNRVVGKTEEPTPDVEEQVALPDPKPVAYTPEPEIYAPEPEPEFDVDPDLYVGPEDDIDPDLYVGPEDDEPEDSVEDAPALEPVVVEIQPIEIIEPEPEPVVAVVDPVPEFKVPSPPKKTSATEKIKSLWPFSKAKKKAEVPAEEPAPELPEREIVAPPSKPAPVKPAPAKAKAKGAAPAVAPAIVVEPVVEPIAEPTPTAPPPPPAPSSKTKRPAALKKVAPVVAPQPIDEEPERKSWFSRLKDGLSKSSKSITSQITTIFTKRKLDAETLQDLEDTLIQADLGITVSERIIKAVAHGRYDKEVDPEEVKQILATEVAKVLRPVEVPFNFGAEKPFVILVVGVNGSGKTTTIGKLGAIASQEGFKVKFAACDTFRAAAIEQLTVWGQRIGAETISRQQGADAAGLAFDAMKACAEDGTDILFVDTAGRLHNKAYLMDELDKVVRVIKKYDAAAPHAVLLVLDATTGQNALAQAEAFTKVAGVTGLIMTKLDGTARGGILVAIAEKFKLPIHAIGVGETLDDLQPFDAEAFARAIAGLDEKLAL
jgi:fused signal recognition particle receptor